jgi:multidrug resistance efflux pump
MSTGTGPAAARVHTRAARESRRQRRPWWQYVIGAMLLAMVVGAAWATYAVWFSVTHVRTTYARVTGLVVNVAAKGDARVKEVLVRTGDEVSAGQVVARLDNADLESRVQQAKANLAAQESALARAERELEMTIRQTAATVEEAEAEVAAAQARLRQAEAQRQMQSHQQPDEVRRAEAEAASARSQLQDAQATLRRMEKLFEQGAISEYALDTARTNYQVATSAVESAEAALAMARTQAYQSQIREQEVATRAAEERRAKAGLKSAHTEERAVSLLEQDVMAKSAAVEEAEAALEETQTRLAEAELVSPVKGAVVAGPGHSVKDGEVVEMGIPIVTVVSTEVPPWISASISELYVGQVKEGQPALIRIDAYRGRWFKGEVEKVGRATEMSAGQGSPWMLQQVPIKLSFDPAGEDVRHGMTCRAWIDVREK